MKSLLVTIASIALIMSVGCKEKKETSSTQDIANPTESFVPPKDMVAEIYTAKGVIKLGLEYIKTPMTVANFVGLAEGQIKNVHRPIGKPFYDGLTFHRVIADFMIQGGDPTGNGAGNAGYFFMDEIRDDLHHDGPGVLSMANSGPNSNSCQFFITHNATPWLDGIHTVFGKVIEGQEVVNQIAQGDIIDSIRIRRLSTEAKHFDAPRVFEAQKSINAEKQKQQMKNRFSGFQGTPVYKAFEEYVKQAYPSAKKTNSGLYYIIDNRTDGKAAYNGATVRVHYKGTLTNNKVFDESYSKGKPITFTLGKQQVIPGWEEGIALMKKGEKGRLIIPYYLAYGEQGIPGAIGPNETLIFEVELVDVK